MPFKDPQRRQNYQREYQRRWHQDRKARFFDDKQCVDCGASDNLRLSAKGTFSLRDKSGINPWSLSESGFKKFVKRYATVRCISCHNKHAGRHRKDSRAVSSGG